jgi:hypothetical protein
VAAPAAAYPLDDASLIILPATRELSAGHELINGIGVAPDYYVPLTAHDLSTGHAPDIAKALTLLGGLPAPGQAARKLPVQHLPGRPADTTEKARRVSPRSAGTSPLSRDNEDCSARGSELR